MASPRAVMMIAVVLISGLSAVPANPAAPALLTAQPAPIAEPANAMAADKYLNDNALLSASNVGSSAPAARFNRRVNDTATIPR